MSSLFLVALTVVGVSLVGAMAVYWPLSFPTIPDLGPLTQLQFLSNESKANVEQLAKMFPTLQTGDFDLQELKGFFDNLVLPTIRSSSGFHDDLFTFENIREDEPVDGVFNETFADYINDYGADKCEIHWGVHGYNPLLRKWHQLATLERFPYFIVYGTLLGYLRNKNFIPYDGDLDVYVPGWAMDRLRKYAIADPEFVPNYRDRFMLYLHRELGVVGTSLRHRFECNGTLIERYTGLCSFVYNFGRFQYRSRFVDIWEMNYFPTIKKGVTSNGPHMRLFDPSLFFPRRHCTLDGIRTWCPNDPIKLVKLEYADSGVGGIKSLRPNRMCVNGTYIVRKSAETEVEKDLLSKDSLQWDEKYATKAALEETSDAANGLVKRIPLHEFCALFDPKTSPDFPPDCRRINEETVRGIYYKSTSV